MASFNIPHNKEIPTGFCSGFDKKIDAKIVQKDRQEAKKTD